MLISNIGPMLISSMLLAQVDNPIISRNFGSGMGYLEFTVSSLVNILFLIATIIFVFIFIVGAFQWITSGSDKNKLGEAKGKITHAIVGLLVLLLVFLIVQFVNALLGLNIGMLGSSGSSAECSAICSDLELDPPHTHGYCASGDNPTPYPNCVNSGHDCNTSPVQDCMCCISGLGVEPTSTDPSFSTNEESTCNLAGGTWRQFPDSAVDLCSPPSVILEVLTYGCDCPSPYCWNGSSCQTPTAPTPSSSVGGIIVPPPTSTPTRSPLPPITIAPTSTPIPTATSTRVPTPTNTPRPTNMPIPTSTPTRVPTPIPTSTPMPTATRIPVTSVPPTATPIPTAVPTSPLAFCRDTDSGMDIYNFGIVSENTTSPGWTVVDHPDYCSSNTLWEYACNIDLTPIVARVDCSMYGGAICLRGECCFNYGLGCVNNGDCCSPYTCLGGVCQSATNILLNEGSGKSCRDLCLDSGFGQGSYCQSIGTNATADNGLTMAPGCTTTNVYGCDHAILLSSSIIQCGGHRTYWTYCNCVPNPVTH